MVGGGFIRDNRIGKLQPIVRHHFAQTRHGGVHGLSHHGVMRGKRDSHFILRHRYLHLERAEVRRVEPDVCGLDVLLHHPLHAVAQIVAPLRLLHRRRHGQGHGGRIVRLRRGGREAGVGQGRGGGGGGGGRRRGGGGEERRRRR